MKIRNLKVLLVIFIVQFGLSSYAEKFITMDKAKYEFEEVKRFNIVNPLTQEAAFIYRERAPLDLRFKASPEQRKIFVDKIKLITAYLESKKNDPDFGKSPSEINALARISDATLVAMDNFSYLTGEEIFLFTKYNLLARKILKNAPDDSINQARNYYTPKQVKNLVTAVLKKIQVQSSLVLDDNNAISKYIERHLNSETQAVANSNVRSASSEKIVQGPTYTSFLNSETNLTSTNAVQSVEATK